MISLHPNPLFLCLFLSPLVASSCSTPTSAAYDAYDAGDYESATTRVEPRAEDGRPDAQYLMGLMFDEGEGRPEDDEEAARWYRKAADQGHAAAQNNLGLLYLAGSGVPHSNEEATKWFALAADQGFAPAQTNYGRDVLVGQQR